MSTITLSIEGMTCGHCVSSVRKALTSVPEAQIESVTLGTAVVQVPEANSDRIADAAAAAVTAAGYPATVTRGENAAASATPGATGSAGSCCTPPLDMHAISRTRS